MPAFAPVVYRSRCFAAKAQSAPATAEVLTDAEAIFEAHDTKYANVVQTLHREKEGTFGEYPAIIAAKMGRLTFKGHLYGGSAQPAMMQALLPACGLGYSAGSYVPDMVAPSAPSSTLHTLTAGIVMKQGGLKRFIYNAMGNFKLTLPTSNLAEMDYTFEGIKGAQSDATPLTPNYVLATPLRCVNSALTIGSLTTPKVAEITLDMGNKLTPIKDMTDPSGFYYVMIGNRLVTGSIKLLAGNVAYADILGQWEASNQMAFSCTLNGDGGQTCVITMSALQLLDPEEADEDGKQMWDIKFQSNADDLTFLFGQTATSTAAPTTTVAATTTLP